MIFFPNYFTYIKFILSNKKFSTYFLENNFIFRNSIKLFRTKINYKNIKVYVILSFEGFI